jgi:hypothetical protein
MSNKKESIDLIDYIDTHLEVECQGRNCEYLDGVYNMAEVEFAKELWKKGWRLSRQGTLYCPYKVLKNIFQKK